MRYDENGYRVCDSCLAHYSPGYNHECPPWLKAIVTANKGKFCEQDEKVYLSNPPQLRCKKCQRFWFAHDAAPLCKPVEINTVFPE